MAGNSIFLGVTTSPARDFVAKEILASGAERVFMPCVGRFGVAEAYLNHGGTPGSLITSDIGMFSSMIGHLADGTKSFAELGVELPDDIPKVEIKDDYDIAANAMLRLKYCQIKATHQYGLNARKEMRLNWAKHVEDVRKKLELLVAKLRGLRYDIKDVWDVVEEAVDDEGAAIFINVPTYKGGYDRMFAGSEIRWNEPSVPQYDYTRFPEMLERLVDAKCKAFVYVQRSLEKVEGDWQVVFAHQYSVDRTDYIVGNGAAQRVFASQKVESKEPKHLPIYNDEAITEDSTVSFLKVDADTCLYYRDLFVHKLGQTKGESYLLMLIDGRVVTAVGLNTQFLRRFQSDYVYEVFGISKSSKRYYRLGKLFMFCLTSGDMKKFLMKSFNFGVREPKGIQTTSITTHEEGKTDRSVMKLVLREPLKDGRFRVIYRADFREDTFSDCLKMWLKRWGNRQRVEVVA